MPFSNKTKVLPLCSNGLIAMISARYFRPPATKAEQYDGYCF